MSRWSNEEAKSLIHVVAKYTKSGKKLTDAFKEAAEKIGRPKPTVQGKFYQLFKDIEVDRRDTLLSRFYDGELTWTGLQAVVHGEGEPDLGGRKPRWTTDEEQVLFSEVYRAISQNETKESAYQLVANRLDGRSQASCRSRYLSRLKEEGVNGREQERELLEKLLSADQSLAAKQREAPDTAMSEAEAQRDSGSDAGEPNVSTGALNLLLSRMDALERRMNQLGADVARMKVQRESSIDYDTLNGIRDQLRAIQETLDGSLFAFIGSSPDLVS